MKKIFLLAVVFSALGFNAQAQEEKIKVKDGKVKIKTSDDNDMDETKGLIVFFTPLSVGYTHWINNHGTGYFRDADGKGMSDSTHQLVGNGINVGPQLALLISCGRLKYGIEGGYNVAFINSVEPDNGVSRDVFKLTNNRRKTYTVGAKVMYDIVKGDHISLLPHIGGGTFGLRNDDFSKSNKARLYGKAGILFQLRLGKFSVFADPNYMLAVYKTVDTPKNAQGYIHNINVNLGVGYKF